jgi:hypothetical protein
LLGSVAASPAQASSFGFLPGAEGFSVRTTEAGGSADTQAASHPFELTATIALKLEEGPPQPGGPYTQGDLRDLHLEEPAGLIEDPAAVPACSLSLFDTPRVSPFEAHSDSGESCPDKAQIGVVTLRTSQGTSARSFGLFNLAPPPGAPSRLGFNAYGVPIAFTPHIRQAGGEYGVTLDAQNLPQGFDLQSLRLTLWGTPWALGHNTERGNCLNESDPEAPWGKCSVGRPHTNPATAYLTLPGFCAAPPAFKVAADSWQRPGSYLPSGESDLTDPAWVTSTSAGAASLLGCDKLHFEPEAQGLLTLSRASSPTGFDLRFSQHEEGLLSPGLTAPSQPKRAVVTLSEGMTLNPSLAAGLGVCTPVQFAAETASSPPGAGCPNASKIGDFRVESPLYDEPVAGGIFLAEPFENPFNGLLALYIIAKAPQRGIMVKVAGKVELDPKSGRLKASFDGLPQLPYSHFDVIFREGQRSPLLTPSACGAYATKVAFSPWQNPEATLTQSPAFQIAGGYEGAPCPSGAAAPFSPQAKGGDLNSAAGAKTSFYLHLSRTDTEQEITSYSATLPPGLLGSIAGVPYCPEADIEAAAEAGGAEEEAHPSCPAASEIGRTYAGYGVGAVLAYAPGRLYLAGPYHGSAFSVVAIDSATVGPFDLGTIIVRSAIEVEARSAQVSIDSSASDPIPHIIDGIPIHLRDVRVYIDRPNLMVNPTRCDPFVLTSTLTGSAAPFADPRDIAATAAVPFQASGCAGLGFAPRFAMSLSGGTRHAAFPTLTATVTPRPGDAGIAGAAVTLPPSLFLAQEHIRAGICSRAQLATDACPAEAIYGEAKALTPLLSEPLQGPVYLAASANPSASLPALVAVLHGQGLRILLEGRIDKNHGGIRGSFEGLPDAPVTSFTMRIFGGKKRGILQVAAEHICASPQLAIARFAGQNDVGEALRPRLGMSCGKRRRSRPGGKR